VQEQINDSIKARLESGQYFVDALKWYNTKYISPFSERSFVLIVCIIILMIFISLVLHIEKVLPLTVQVQYSILQKNSSSKTAQIFRADQMENPVTSVTDIFVRNYVNKRESYNYDHLKSQFEFIKNTSTRIVFKKFYDTMNIDNPNSLVLKFQKQASRNINIIDANYDEPGKAIVKFESKAQSQDNSISEDMIWHAMIEYEIDTIDTNLPPGSRFNFTVTNYQLQLIQDKKAK